MNLEQQLEQIKSKAELIKFVDALPDDVRGIILVENMAADWMKFYEVGPITLRDGLWLITAFTSYLQQKTFAACDGDCDHSPD